MMTTTLALSLLFSLPTQPAEPVFIYDLSYALRFDARQPQQVARAWDHAHVVAALQGLVNRDAARLYIRFVSSGDLQVDDYWMDRMRESSDWLGRRPFVPIPDLDALLRQFSEFYEGAVVYDPRVPATSNLASTIAGADGLIPVRFDPNPRSLYSQLVGSGKLQPVVTLLNRDGSPLFTGRGTVPGTETPSTGSAKCDAYLWLKHHYIDTDKVDAGYAGYYIDSYWQQVPQASSPNQHTLTNHDFFVAKKGFFFDLNVWPDETPVDDRQQKPGTDRETLKTLLKAAYHKAGKDRMIHIGGFTPWAFKYTTHGQAGGTHDPVPTEWETVRLVSAYNGFIDADAIGYAAMANASFYMHFPLKQRYQQPWTDKKALVEKKLLNPDGTVRFDDREFIIFYVGDYDAAAWLYQRTHSVWDRPARGRIPLMWCISPILERRAPMAMHYIRSTATENDYFAAADNGAGYLTPGMLQEPRPVSELPSGLDAWAKHCEFYYQRWSLSITGFVIDGFAPAMNAEGFDCYARFSGDGIVPQKVPATLLHQRMPVLRAGHDLGNDPRQAADLIAERVKARTIPFHWFRAILKPPEWYVQVYQQARRKNPKIELLDAPSFFELYRIYLMNHPEAAQGKVDSPR